MPEPVAGWMRYLFYAVLSTALLATDGCRAEPTAQRGGAVIWLANQPPSLRIGPEPSLVVDQPGLGDEAFADVQGVALLSDRRIAVADASIPAVMIYTEAGSLSVAVGRNGDGPGEYRRPRLIGVTPGDSLVIYDVQTRRLLLFASSGAFLRSITLGGLPGSVLEVLRFGDGEVWLKRNDHRPAPSPTGNRLVEGSIVRYDPGGKVTTVVAAFPGGLLHPRGFLFYGWLASAIVTDSSIWLGLGNQPEVVEYEIGHGGPRRRLRWTHTVHLVDDAQRAAMIDLARSRNASPDMMTRDRFADTVPVFSRLLPDPGGGLWIIGYEAPFATSDSAWYVRPNAATIETIPIPRGFRPTAFARHAVAGVLFDDDGIPRPAIFPLHADDQLQ